MDVTPDIFSPTFRPSGVRFFSAFQENWNSFESRDLYEKHVGVKEKTIYSYCCFEHRMRTFYALNNCVFGLPWKLYGITNLNSLSSLFLDERKSWIWYFIFSTLPKSDFHLLSQAYNRLVFLLPGGRFCDGGLDTVSKAITSQLHFTSFPQAASQEKSFFLQKTNHVSQLN